MVIAIGTSGFNYEHWSNGVFYPADLPQSRWLEYYCRFFDTVELNVTFYRLPSKAAFEGWRKRTPKKFIYSLKGSRFITHVKRLKDPKDPVRIFFEQSAPLKTKTKVILWQLPPQMRCDLKRLEDFVSALKKYKKPYHAFEFRHESWMNDDVFSLIRDNKMSICHADWPEFSREIPDDFPFLYVRRHGPTSGFLYAACYSEKQLKEDGEKIRSWAKQGKDVFVYFNNDAAGYAVKNALRLKELVHS